MSDEVFFDTNIIAYAFDRSDERKRQPCQRLVRSGFQGDLSSCLSNQVLGELFLVLTKKVGRPLSKKVAGTIVRGFIDSPRWKKLNYSHLTVRKALDDVGTMNASFWDVLIAETMRDSGVTRLYTENETDFRKIPWVEVLNPLRSSIADAERRTD